MRRLTILGSTGSVGESTIDLVTRNRDAYQVVALTAHSNWEKLSVQAKALRPEMVALADVTGYGALKAALAGTGITVAAGEEAVCDAARLDADWVMAAIVGAAGLKPTLAAVERGAVVALANKECLVSAGAIFMAAVARHGATLLPVDSEHNAIFQVFDFDQHEKITKIILTASGGPFRTMSFADMRGVTPAQAVAHPNWSMGAKISVDSATMMNKGLEVIEAHHLFRMPADRIEIVVHPQSVVHSMVEYADGSVLAQLGSPDMRTPIAYALGWPNRLHAPTERLNLARLGSLTFEAPDLQRFPALRLAQNALVAGGAAPTVLNAANEVAVARFLAGDIGFLEIAAIVDHTLDRVSQPALTCLDDILAVDDEARVVAGAAKNLSIAAE
ncbi:MAG: 1-deoxy-D-xylulose-5-phosphate reductoisomerase [Rhodospirillaceae bacterium]